jgi:hypothetical protein
MWRNQMTVLYRRKTLAALMVSDSHNPEDFSTLHHWMIGIYNDANTGRFLATQADKCPIGLSRDPYLRGGAHCIESSNAARDGGEIEAGEFWTKVADFLTEMCRSAE